MSTSMAVRGDGFSIVASDTRTTHLETKDIRDNCEKMFRYSHGWVATSGGVALQTRFFRGRLNSCQYNTRKDIYTLWLRSVKDTQDLAAKYGVKDTEPEMSSCQAFISIGPGEVNSMDFKYARRKLNGSSIVFNPPKSTKRIRALVTKYSVQPADLNEALYVMSCFLGELARLTKWVSDTLDAGICLKMDEETLFLHLRADTATIKQAYKKGTLPELLMVETIKPIKALNG